MTHNEFERINNVNCPELQWLCNARKVQFFSWFQFFVITETLRFVIYYMDLK